MRGEYNYRNVDDTLRFCIYRHDLGGWDYEVFDRSLGYVGSFTTRTGESPLFTRKEAKAIIQHEYGPVQSISSNKGIMSGWLGV